MKIYAGHIIDGRTICGTERQRIYHEYNTVNAAIKYKLGQFIKKHNGYTRVELFPNDNVYGTPAKVLYYDSNTIPVNQLESGYTE